MTVHPDHDMADDMAEFAVANKRNFIPQGCDQQGRHTPTISVEGCAVEDDDQTVSATGEVVRMYLLLFAVAAVALVSFRFLMWALPAFEAWWKA